MSSMVHGDPSRLHTCDWQRLVQQGPQLCSSTSDATRGHRADRPAELWATPRTPHTCPRATSGYPVRASTESAGVQVPNREGRNATVRLPSPQLDRRTHSTTLGGDDGPRHDAGGCIALPLEGVERAWSSLPVVSMTPLRRLRVTSDIPGREHRACSRPTAVTRTAQQAGKARSRWCPGRRRRMGPQQAPTGAGRHARGSRG